MISLVRVLLVAIAACVALAAADAAEQVDLLLVLAADVSRSVDHPKFLLQREGYAAAISDPHVIDAVRSGPHQRIALCFVEWSGFGAQRLVIDWTMIDGVDAARRFGDQLLELPRSFADRTSISWGLNKMTYGRRYAIATALLSQLTPSASNLRVGLPLTFVYTPNSDSGCEK